jgi:hypothetical protein
MCIEVGVALYYYVENPLEPVERENDRNVADPGCLYRILMVFHLGSRVQKQQKRGCRWKK